MCSSDLLQILCLNEADGSVIWKRQFWVMGSTMCHKKTSVAAPTPVTDGKLLFAIFSSNDLFCLDLDGNLKWLRGLTVDYPNEFKDGRKASSSVVRSAGRRLDLNAQGGGVGGRPRRRARSQAREGQAASQAPR